MSHPGPTVDPNCRVASASCPPPRATYYCDTVFILNIQWRLNPLLKGVDQCRQVIMDFADQIQHTADQRCGGLS